MNDAVRLIHGDCIEVMAGMDAASVDAVVTDPPYSLAFMGRPWDEHGGPLGFQHWCQTWGETVLRIAKPGAHLLAFGGTRTHHRLYSGLEDAGWEIRDTIAWLYGQGFPKSHNLDGRWEGWGTALKPAFEPIVVARKPLGGTVAANVERWGTGTLNIDACRIPMSQTDRASIDNMGGFGKPGWSRPDGTLGDTYEGNRDGSLGHKNEAQAHPQGRWPANVALDPTAATMLDEQTGDLPAATSRTRRPDRGFLPGATNGQAQTVDNPVYADSGGASRFFYCSKASTTEKPWRNRQANTDDAAMHPTVKPLDLMRWLIRLVTPRDALVLDPFAGTGTTGEAAIMEGRRAVLIEREADYCELIRRRLAKPIQPTLL